MRDYIGSMKRVLRVSRTRLFLLATALLLTAGLAGCANGSLAVTGQILYRTISDPAIAPGDVIPRPQGDVVLTISGRLGPAAGGDGVLELDMATLEALGLVEMQVDDQIAEGRTVVFQGVLLLRLLEAAQVEAGARVLTMTALNDYAVEIPVADAASYPVLIATRADGERMSVEHYGPLRIIYPFGLLPLSRATFEPRSIWQLYLIRAG
ncbi:MAG: molybdopterin-dependent oxidoreductase [Anaerolineae bacterium]|nr:molybdopterin-dependent oxidoreductase [Anaerolineae bacterium]